MSNQGLISSSLQSLLSIVKPAENAGIPITLIKLPQNLSPSAEKPVTLAGKIIEHLQNQTTSIKTDSGTIIAKTVANNAFQASDSVQITLIKPQDSEGIQAFLQKTQAPQNTVRHDATTTTLSQNSQSKTALPTPEKLTRELQIEVKPTSTQELKTLQNSPIEKIDTKLPLQSKFSIQGDKSSQHPIQSTISTASQNGERLLNGKVNGPITKTETQLPQQNKVENSVQIKTPGQINSVVKIQSDLTHALKTSTPPTNNPPSTIRVTSITAPAPQLTDSGKAHNNQAAITTTINTASTPPAQIRAGQAHAQLIGFTKSQNFPVLQIIPSAPKALPQHFTIQTPIENFPVGSRVTLYITETQSQITGAAQNASATEQAIQTKHALAFLTPNTSWPTLSDIEQALQHGNPAIAQHFTNTLPTPAQPNQINAASLFFLAAIRSGDVQSWLGDKASELLRTLGKSELINRLSGELSSINTLNIDPPTQDWRSLTLPMSWQEEIHQIVLHYRKQNHDGDNEHIKDGEQTRFVMDIKLSNIGDVQIDGLFAKSTDRQQKLDLILRSARPFSEAMRMQMQNLYQGALHNVGFDGALGFQQRAQWVNITQEIEPEYTENI